MSDAISKPAEAKHWVQQFFEKARGDLAKAAPATPASYVRETGSAVGELLEGGAVGSLLGATHAKWGLDTAGGPIDGWIAGLGTLMSIGVSGHFPEVAVHLRKVGGQAFTVYSFRKGYEIVKHAPLAGGAASPNVQRVAVPGKGPGVHGEDPIEKVARDLG
jgi:hypothetical protein